MKYWNRLLALFCVLALLLGSLSSCTPLFLLLDPDLWEEAQPEPEQNLPAGDKMEYTLSETDRKLFSAALEEVERLILTERSNDEAKISAAMEKMEDQYYHIATQTELAYIYHCMDQASTERSEAYLYAYSMQTEAYEIYLDASLRIDQSDAPYRNSYFSDWSEEDIESMRGYSEELTKLKNRNNQILVTYRALSQAEQNQQAAEFYLQLMENNTRIAQLKGYESYPEYAYAKIYKRDYTPADATFLHEKVKTTLMPLCQVALERFQNSYRQLNAKQRNIVRALLEGEYGNAWDLLDAYLSSFPQEAEKQLRTLFETENHVLTSSQNADAGAFTTYLYEYDQPFCYFGPGYHNGYSILHEMGHYFSCFYSENDLQMDLAETQSQANEWLFTAFLDHYDQNGLLSQTVFYYQLHSSLQTIVMASIIDEFEQSVYLNPPASTEEFEQRMDWVCEGYGGTKTVQTLFADPQRYWRAVVLDNPCYYISYAFSMLVSTNFYGVALEDVPSAYQAYLSLAEVQLEDGTYCAWLQEQGIPTPFEDQLYQNLLSAVS